MKTKPTVAITDWCLGARPIAGGKLIVAIDGLRDGINTWTSSIERIKLPIIETKNTLYKVCGMPKQFLTKYERVEWGKYILRDPNGKRICEARRDGSRWTAFGLTFNTLWGCRVKADFRYLNRSCR